MRFSEFSKPIFEDLSHMIEDDADSLVTNELIDTLREIQYSAKHTQVPKIAVQALINLVKNKPGAEAFNLEALMNAKKNNEAVSNIIADIKDNDEGIKYVFINPVDSSEMDGELSDEEQSAVQTQPEKTVGSMAKRALSKRD